MARDLSGLEAALLCEPSVYDCAVRLRERQEGAPRVVAYVVPGSGYLQDRLRARVQRSSPVQPDVFVELSGLPFSAEGQIDEQALATLPVIDEEFLLRYEEQLILTPGILEAAVTMEEYEPESLPLHLSDLLPAGVGSATVVEPVRTVAPEAQPVAPLAAAKPAITHGGPLRNPEIPKVMADVLKRAAEMPASHGIVYVQRDGSELYQSYAELLQDAERILTGFRNVGLKPGDPVVFQVDRNRDFVAAFWACMLGGFVAAPISIAPTYKERSSAVDKLQNCWEVLNRPFIVAGETLAPEVRSIAGILGLRDLRVGSIEQLRANQRTREWHTGTADDICLILFTSGSTGTPKGVQQPQRNLLWYSVATAERHAFDEREVSLNWFPLDHVGGIIMMHLLPVYTRAHQVQAPTEYILQNPLHWLDLIERHRATITWAPNFAFGLVNKHEAEIAAGKWDLSSMRFAINGGEAIIAKTARRFLQILAAHGLPPNAMRPAWGMSETSSGVLFSDRCTCDIVHDEDSFVEVGAPVPGVSLRIVDGKDQVVEEGEIGRLQASGATVTPGYFRNPDLNRESFLADGWFNTGDLALIREGQLTITGRAKDVIIINGVNFYSHEIESIVEEVEGVDVSFTVASAVQFAGADTDRLAVFFATSAQGWPAVLDVMRRIREILLRRAGVHADFLIPVSQQDIPKSAIGKIQRTQLRQQFEAGQFAQTLKQIDISSGGSNTVPDWFYRKVWRRREGLRTRAVLPSGTYLVFADDRGMADMICDRLRLSGARTLQVIAGKSFSQRDANVYTVGIDSLSDYERLIQTVGVVDHVVHCLAYDTSRGNSADSQAIHDAQKRGVYSLLLLIKAIAKRREDARVRLLAVTNAAQAVAAGDRLCPEKSPIIGLLASAGLEFPGLECRHVDVAGDVPATDADHVLRELTIKHSRSEVVYRRGSRLAMFIEKVDMLGQAPRMVPIKNDGLYLVTGGLGGLGTIVAEHLMREYHARLLLVGRTRMPENAPTAVGRAAKRRRNHASLGSLGGEFLYRALDLQDTDALRSCVAEAESRWGRQLDGVFHLAGSLGTSEDLKSHFDAIDEHGISAETVEAFETIFTAKLYGTRSVVQLLQHRHDALLVAFSSVNGVFGGATFSAYAAANSALDALMLRHRQDHPNTYCFNWTMWDELGMSENSPAYSRDSSRSAGYQVIDKQQGINSMLAGLCRTEPQLIIGLDSSSSFLRRYVDAQVYPRFRPVAYFVPRTNAASIGAGVVSPIQQTNTFRHVSLSQLPRSASGSIDWERLASLNERRAAAAITEPRTEMERDVARIWTEVLGVSRIDMTDTFFQLGGDSLTAMRLVNRLRETLHVNLTVRMLFEKPTIVRLAAMLAEAKDGRATAAMSPAVAVPGDLLGRVDQMSDGEVDALLDEMARGDVSK